SLRPVPAAASPARKSHRARRSPRPAARGSPPRSERERESPGSIWQRAPGVLLRPSELPMLPSCFPSPLVIHLHLLGDGAGIRWRCTDSRTSTKGVPKLLTSFGGPPPTVEFTQKAIRMGEGQGGQKMTLLSFNRAISSASIPSNFSRISSLSWPIRG